MVSIFFFHRGLFLSPSLALLAIVAISFIGIADDSIIINGDDDLTAANGVSAGNGTAADPFFIEDMDITGPDTTAIFINYTTKHIRIRNITFATGNQLTVGIRLDHVSNCTISGVTNDLLPTCVDIDYCENIIVENVFSQGGRFHVTSSENVTLSNLTFRPHNKYGLQEGIGVWMSSRVLVTGCDVMGYYNYSTGIYVSTSSMVTIVDNIIRDVYRGIDIEADWDKINKDVVIEGNRISDYQFLGIMAYRIDGLGIANNTMQAFSDFYAMSLNAKNTWYVRDNNMNHGGIYVGHSFVGEVVWDFSNNLLMNREIFYYVNETGRDLPADSHELILFNCSDCTVNGASAGSYHPWMILYECSNITISDLAFSYMLFGIVAYDDSRLTIENCSFLGFRYGMILGDSTGLLIRGNRFEDCTHGLVLDECPSTRVTNNTFMDCFAGLGEGMEPNMYDPGPGLVVDNNTFEGCRYAIGFKKIGHALVVDNRFLNISSIGLFIDYPSFGTNANVTIARNVLTNVKIGMRLRRVEDLDLRTNIIEGSEIGIEIEWPESGTIAWNEIRNSTMYGMKISPMYNGVIITANTFEDSFSYAIVLWGPGSRIYLNDFINNSWGYNASRQVYDRYGNQWSSNKMGNYWSDYEEWYPDATNDGVVWSKPYAVDYTGTYNDHYPLVHRFDLEPPVAYAGEDQVVEEGTMVTLDGTGSSDDRGIVRYVWTFTHDGESIILGGPIVGYTFAIPGKYPVLLWVSDAVGNTDLGGVYITVLDILPPIANAGSPIEVEQFKEAKFDGSGSYDSGLIINYTWTVEFATDTVVLHGIGPELYCPHAGVFNVTLKVMDMVGHTSEATTTLRVLDREPPVVVLEDSYILDQGQTLQLDASSCTDNVGIVQFRWTLYSDEGRTDLDGVLVTYTWITPGEYNCSLTLLDEELNEVKVWFSVRVQDTEPPTIGIIEDMEVVIGVPMRFPWVTLEDNVGVVDITWTFQVGGETVALEDTQPYFTFHASGEYWVNLTVSDPSGHWASTEFIVTVVDPFGPEADAGPDLVVDMGDIVTLSGEASSDNEGVDRYSWSFEYKGEQQELEGVDVPFRFDEVGVYHVTLTVWDLSGNEATDTLTITVRDSIPPVAVAVVPSTAKVGEEVTLRGEDSEDNVGVVNWTWTIEHNGSTIVLHGAVTGFTFEVPGIYKVLLTVRDSGGLEGEFTTTITVTDQPEGPDNGDDGEPFDNALDAIVAFVITILVVVILVTLAKVRRRGGGDGKEASADEWMEYQ